MEKQTAVIAEPLNFSNQNSNKSKHLKSILKNSQDKNTYSNTVNQVSMLKVDVLKETTPIQLNSSLNLKTEYDNVYKRAHNKGRRPFGYKSYSINPVSANIDMLRFQDIVLAQKINKLSSNLEDNLENKHDQAADFKSDSKNVSINKSIKTRANTFIANDKADNLKFYNHNVSRLNNNLDLNKLDSNFDSILTTTSVSKINATKSSQVNQANSMNAKHLNLPPLFKSTTMPLKSVVNDNSPKNSTVKDESKSFKSTIDGIRIPSNYEDKDIPEDPSSLFNTPPISSINQSNSLNNKIDTFYRNHVGNSILQLKTINNNISMLNSSFKSNNHSSLSKLIYTNISDFNADPVLNTNSIQKIRKVLKLDEFAPQKQSSSAPTGNKKDVPNVCHDTNTLKLNKFFNESGSLYGNNNINSNNSTLMPFIIAEKTDICLKQRAKNMKSKSHQYEKYNPTSKEENDDQMLQIAEKRSEIEFHQPIKIIITDKAMAPPPSPCSELNHFNCVMCAKENIIKTRIFNRN